MKRILVVGDGAPPDWFRSLAEERGYSVSSTIIRSSRFSPLLRHLCYFYLAVVALFRQYQYDQLLIWQQFVAFYFSLLSRLLPRTSSKICAAYVLYNPSSRPLVAALKRAFFKFCLRDPRISKWVFFSEHDHFFIELPPERRAAISYAQEESSVIQSNKHLPKESVYLFSGGTSNRDNELLAQVWRKPGLPPLKAVVLDRSQIPAASPESIEWHVNLSEDEFDVLLARSAGVIIPLRNPDVLSGQIVILKSLEASLPVFVTQSIHLDSWIDEQELRGRIFKFQTADQLHQLIHAGAKDPPTRTSGAHESTQESSMRAPAYTFSLELLRVMEICES